MLIMCRLIGDITAPPKAADAYDARPDGGHCGTEDAHDAGWLGALLLFLGRLMLMV